MKFALFNKSNNSTQEIDSTKTSEFQLKKLDSLIKKTKSNKDIALMVDYSEKYIDLAIKSKNYDKAINRGIKIIYYVNTQLQQRERAFHMIDKLEKIKDKVDDSFLIGCIYLKKGGLYFNGKDYNKAIDNYTIAIDKFTSKDSIHIADALFFKGQAYYNANNFHNALDNFELALDYYTNLNDNDYIFYTKSSIINIHGANGFIKKTIKERKKLINEKIATKFTQGLSGDYQNLASDLKKDKQFIQQEYYLLKALKFSNKENNEFNNLSFIYCDLAAYYLDNGHQIKAERYYNLALTTITNNENENYFYYQKLKGYYLYKKTKFKEALAITQKSLVNAKEQNHTQNVIDAEELLYKIYKGQNNLSKSLEHYTTYNHIKDSLFNIEKINTLYYYQTLHESKLKEQKINEQETSINSLIKDKKNKQLSLYLLLLSSISVISLGFLLLNRFHLKKNQKLQDAYSQNLLSYIDNERKRISKDIHDSLGHKLLLVKNEALLNKNEKICILADESINEIRTISRNLQPIQVKQIGITKSIQLLISELASSYKDTMIFGDIENIDNLISFKQEMSAYRIIQECLNNIIKHSKADSAKVSISIKKKHIFLNIRDNGIGYNYCEKFKNHKSLGLKNIENRVASLKGSIKTTTKHNKGTIIKISIPLK